jgi:hypothetical protein
MRPDPRDPQPQAFGDVLKIELRENVDGQQVLRELEIPLRATPASPPVPEHVARRREYWNRWTVTR